VAPGMGAQVVPPSLERTHWNVGAGRPEANAEKAALLPAATVRLAGCALKTGLATAGGGACVVLLLVPQPRPGRRKVRARLTSSPEFTKGRGFDMVSSCSETGTGIRNNTSRQARAWPGPGRGGGDGARGASPRSGQSRIPTAN